MTLSEVKELLEHLENEISKYEFDIDKNFTMNSKKMISNYLLKRNRN